MIDCQVGGGQTSELSPIGSLESLVEGEVEEDDESSLLDSNESTVFHV